MSVQAEKWRWAVIYHYAQYDVWELKYENDAFFFVCPFMCISFGDLHSETLLFVL